MFKQNLCQLAWSVTPVGDLSEVPAAAKGSIPAEVPGCIHLDLIRAGIIKHPREGFAELDQFWVGKTDWRYECRFEAGKDRFEHECIDLVCDGLDTIATLELNGQVIGTAANMFHPHRFRLSNLKSGENHLAITFKSPLRHIREEEARLAARPVNGDWDPYIFIRKAAVNFGWDFAPKVPTSGIWKSIRLESWSRARIAGVRPIIRRARDNAWHVSVETDLEWSNRNAATPPGLLLGVSLENHDLDAWGTAVLDYQVSKATVSFDVENPRIWWPSGHGGQPLYSLKLSLQMIAAPYGNADDWTGNIGFREVRLNTEPDEHGSKFQFEVNGKPIFCKGANWVPDALFPTEVTTDRYRTRVKQAADANMNMLRVWGGGYYEDEEFYRACDELGILVWQDFMFACAMYPEEAPYPALVEAEARHQITRLSSHASVALWCGGNECVWAYESWGNALGETPWKVRLGEKTWGRLYYLDLLPRLMKELDPTRPYWANSPWSGSEAVPTNGQRHGDRHTWDAPGNAIRTVVPRFCSEFGQQSPSVFETLRTAIGDERCVMASPDIMHRQRATTGIAMRTDVPSASQREVMNAFIHWHVTAGHSQALFLTTAVEWLRAHRGRCMGGLVWQLNEMWPGLSWSLIDADGRPKHALSKVRKSFSPRLITMQPVNARLCLVGVNDSAEAWRDTARLARRDFREVHPSSTASVKFAVPPGSVVTICDIEELVGAPADAQYESAYAECHELRAGWQYAKAIPVMWHPE